MKHRRCEDECPDCGQVMEATYDEDGPAWLCECGHVHSRKTYPDPDEAYDRMRDREVLEQLRAERQHEANT